MGSQFTRRRFVLGSAAVIVGTIVAPRRWAKGASPQLLSEIDVVLDPHQRGSTVRTSYVASHIGVRWVGRPDDAPAVRWRHATREWSPWRPFPVADDLADRSSGTVFSGLLVTGGTNEFQVRAPGTDLPRLTVIPIDAYVVASATPEPAPPHSQAPEAPLSIVRRREWGADESRRRGRPRFAAIERVSVHHTVTPNDDPDPAATVRAIFAYHTQARGWDDIGYNFLIDAHGRTYEGRFSRDYGRDETPNGEDLAGHGVIGAHTGTDNPGTVGVALLGDHRTAAPSAPALASLTALVSETVRRHDIDPVGYTAWSAGMRPTIIGHRDVMGTACPGGRLHAELPRLRQRVSDRVAGRTSGPCAEKGYWILEQDGSVIPFGDGSLPDAPPESHGNRVISLAVTPTGGGYWTLLSDGQVRCAGEAAPLGSTADRSLNAPVVDLVGSPSRFGYWVAAADGGVFAFGDAEFFGSAATFFLAAAITGMAPSPTGKGYWLVAADGGVFSFGDAKFFGSAVDSDADDRTVGIEPSPGGDGYWLLTAAGQVLPFGPVGSFGDMASSESRSAARNIRIRASGTGEGYWVLAEDGTVSAFGDACSLGSAARQLPAGSVVTDMAVMRPSRATKDDDDAT